MFDSFPFAGLMGRFCPAWVELSYRVDMVTWNQYLRWGVVYIRLHSGRTSTEARIDQ